MKQKTFLLLLGGVFAALMVLVLSIAGLPSVFSSVTAFPFELLGACLRALSLTGGLGNGLAVALCTALSMLPVLLALRHRGERGFLGENIVLWCMGIVILLTLYSMANPAKLLAAFPFATADFLPLAKGVMGCTVWSFFVLWMVLRLIRIFRAGNTKQLLGNLRAVLYALCLLFDAMIPLSCGSTLVKNLSAAQQNMDGVMAVLGFMASSLPYLLDIGITLALLTLLEAYITANHENIVKNAPALSHSCCLALGITAASTAALNVLQLLLSRFLSNVSVNVNLPIVSLAFLLLILLLSRLIVENRRLQSDNDLFI